MAQSPHKLYVGCVIPTNSQVSVLGRGVFHHLALVAQLFGERNVDVVTLTRVPSDLKNPSMNEELLPYKIHPPTSRIEITADSATRC